MDEREIKKRRKHNENIDTGIGYLRNAGLLTIGAVSFGAIFYTVAGNDAADVLALEVVLAIPTVAGMGMYGGYKILQGACGMAYDMYQGRETVQE